MSLGALLHGLIGKPRSFAVTVCGGSASSRVGLDGSGLATSTSRLRRGVSRYRD